MKLGIRAKLFLLSFTAIALSIGAAYLFMRSRLDELLTRQVAEELTVRAQLLKKDATEQRADLDDLVRWDAMADAWAAHARVRATIIRRDGVVLGDSGVPPELLASVENHGARPEVVRAMTHGHAVSQRLSATVDHRLLYVAVPFHRDGRVVGVARVALELTQLDAALQELTRVVTLAMVIALVVAAFLATAASQVASRTARDLTAAARKMASGDLSTRAGTGGHDEFAALGQALDTLAENLSRSLAELRTERDRLGGVLAGMQEGVLMLDADGRIALLNPALRGMLLIQGDWEARLARDAIAHRELVELLDGARVAQEPVAHEIALDGLKPRRLLVRAAPLDGDEKGVFAVFVDVTEVRKLETLRKDFVANVSHELRTPVTAIRSAAETLGSVLQGDPAAGQRFVDIIDRNAARLSGLVEDLLDLSRIESRELTLNFEPIEAEAFFGQIIELFRERSERRGIRLVNMGGAVASEFLADPRALENVLTNLVDNAVKYAGSGAEVRLVARDAGDAVRIGVEDTGPGIEPRHLPRLFERFYRVDTGRSRELGGTGLGLSIVKHLVEAMGSQILVQSQPGQGTTFGFTLRKVSPERAADGAVAVAPRGVNADG